MAKKTTKTEKKEEPVKQTPKFVTVRYEQTHNAAIEYKVRTVKYRKNEFGQTVKVQIASSLPEVFVMKSGDEIEVPEDAFKRLVKSGVFRDKTQMEQRQALIDNRTPLFKMTPVERNLVLNDLPHEV